MFAITRMRMRMILLLFLLVVVIVSSGQDLDDEDADDDDHSLISFHNETEIQSNWTQFKKIEPESNQLLARAAVVDPLRRCDLTFNDLEFYFTNPEYPGPYSNNLDCLVTVKRSRDVCRLLVLFQFFKVQPSDGCLSDFLQIGDERLCGTLPSDTTKEFSFTGSELRMKFRTDAFGTAPGFFIRARQVPCGTDVAGGSSQGRCDVLVDQAQFDITNRNWPLDTPLDCTFTIRKFDPDVCSLHLIFVALDLNCQFEYLDIGQRRFCSQPKDQFQMIDFLGFEFLIRFHSGRTDRNSRLSVRVIQRMCRKRPSTSPSIVPPPPFIPPSEVPSKAVTTTGRCLLNPDDGGTTTWARNFLLRSPSYPMNTDCVYVVRKNSLDVCSLLFLVQEFRLKSTPNCDSNFLAVGNERLCGSLPQGSVRVFEFPNDEILIRFFSDTFRVGRFALSVSQRSCKQPTPVPPAPIVPIPGGFNCDAFYTTASFVFWSTPVPPSSVCTTTVSKAGSQICSLQLYFQVFDFGLSDPLCSLSFLDVKGDRLCDRSVEGTTRTYSFDGSNIQIRYYSSYGTSKFRIVALQRPCRREPPFPIDSCERGRTPSVVSDPRFRLRHSVPYDSFVDCVYVVLKSSPRVCQLRIDFVYFDLEAGDRCSNEFLEINGIRFCGNEATGTKKSFDFVGSELYIRFRSGLGSKKPSYGRPLPRGFILDGDQLECYVPSLPPPPQPPQSSCCCNRTFSSSEVSLAVGFDSKSFSPQPPSYCVYTICKHRSDICNIEVEFLAFRLPKSKSNDLSCEDHFLEIEGRRHCGTIPSGTVKRYEFPNEVFRLAYGSGGGVPFFNGGGGGFSIRIRQIPCLVLPVNLIQRNDPYFGNLETDQAESLDPSPPFGGCGVVYDKTDFYWSSPSFPQRYGHNVDCALTIRKTNPNVCRLFVAFRYFDVEYSESCSKDYLQIISERFCGWISVPFERFFTFGGDSTVLNFHSDNSGSKLGFSIYVKQESCDESPRLNRNSTL